MVLRRLWSEWMWKVKFSDNEFMAITIHKARIIDYNFIGHKRLLHCTVIWYNEWIRYNFITICLRVAGKTQTLVNMCITIKLSQHFWESNQTNDSILLCMDLMNKTFSPTQRISLWQKKHWTAESTRDRNTARSSAPSDTRYLGSIS